MRVLVTGGCGFLGSHICEMYRKKGDEVVCIDNMTKYEFSRSPYNVELARTHNWNFLKGIGVELHKEDIRNKESLFKVAKGCDFIAHTAAQPAMTIALEDPELDFSTNVMGTYNVLECARKYDIPMASCSTIHVYGNRINQHLKEAETRFERTPPTIPETDPVLNGDITPLHASKRSAEIYVECFIDTYGLKAANFRLTGMYGPRQIGSEDHGWVANFAIKTVMQTPIKVYGTDKQVRDILYATDAAEAFDAFYKAQKPGTYNIGGGMKNTISLKEALDLMHNITRKKQDISFGPARKGDLWYFVCDIAKAKSALNWEPKVSNEEGIRRLVEWIEHNTEMFRGKKQS